MRNRELDASIKRLFLLLIGGAFIYSHYLAGLAQYERNALCIQLVNSEIQSMAPDVRGYEELRILFNKYCNSSHLSGYFLSTVTGLILLGFVFYSVIGPGKSEPE